MLINGGQQLMVLIQFPVQWPASILALGAVLTGINLDFISFASPSCLGAPLNYYARFGLLILSVALVIGVPWLFSFIRHKCLQPNPEKWRAAIKARLRDTYLLVMLFHPTVTGQAFYFFRCRRVGNETNGTDYLMVDYTIKCFDDTWYAVLMPILIIIVFFSLGVPLLIAGWLYRHRTTLDDPATRRLLGIIYAAFRPAMFFYDTVNMMFKVFLWAILVFFDHGSQFQQVTATLICVIQLSAHARFQPYRDPFKNWLQYAGLSLVAITSFGGLVINYLEVTEALGVALGDKEKTDLAKAQNAGFKAVLSVVLWVGILIAVGRMLSFASKILRKNRAVMKCGRKLRRVCCGPCGCGGSAVEAAAEEDAEEDAGVELREITGPEVKMNDEGVVVDAGAQPGETDETGADDGSSGVSP